MKIVTLCMYRKWICIGNFLLTPAALHWWFSVISSILKGGEGKGGNNYFAYRVQFYGTKPPSRESNTTEVCPLSSKPPFKLS